MADQVQVNIIGTNELVARLGRVPDSVRGRVRLAVQSVTSHVALLAKTKLPAGPLRNSIDVDYAETAEQMTGRAFSEGIPYARIQEYGGVTPPHDIVPVNAKALAFMAPAQLPISKSGGNELVFAKVVHHPGSRIPEKAYLRGSLAELRSVAIAEIHAAVAAGAATAMEP